MKEYLTNLAQRFDDVAHLARFIGISPHTLHSWRFGRRAPRGAELRMLEVLGILARESPALLATLAASTRIVKQPKQTPALPKIPSGPYGNWVERPAPPEVSMYLPRVEPLPVVTQDKWSDSYWEPRTVASLDDDPTIPVDVTMNAAGLLNDTETDRYWESCRLYEQRTGRIFPN